MKDIALLAAGIVFLAVSIMHLLRLLFKVEIKIRNSNVPQWLSGIGFLAALALSVWMFKAVQ